MRPPHHPPPGSLSLLLAELAHVPEAPLDQAPPPSLASGAVVGPYRNVAELGRGSFGVVFEAQPLDSDGRVALKLVRPGRTEVGHEQLQREADTIARLSHPNLVSLLDAGRCEAGPYLVLELLRGCTLRDRLREGRLVAEHGHEAPFQVAGVHARRGDADQAFGWLDRALASNDGGLQDLRIEPLLFRLHADPRVPALLARVGLEQR